MCVTKEKTYGRLWQQNEKITPSLMHLKTVKTTTTTNEREKQVKIRNTNLRKTRHEK